MSPGARYDRGMTAEQTTPKGGNRHVRHRWTPGLFGGGCQVQLARYPCPYSEDEHEPGPPEDVDVFGRGRRGRDA